MVKEDAIGPKNTQGTVLDEDEEEILDGNLNKTYDSSDGSIKVEDTNLMWDFPNSVTWEIEKHAIVELPTNNENVRRMTKLFVKTLDKIGNEPEEEQKIVSSLLEVKELVGHNMFNSAKTQAYFQTVVGDLKSRKKYDISIDNSDDIKHYDTISA